MIPNKIRAPVRSSSVRAVAEHDTVPTSVVRHIRHVRFHEHHTPSGRLGQVLVECRVGERLGNETRTLILDRNIELAAQALDGEVIAPRTTLSFNDIVGERSLERGFAPAIELARGGRRTEGVGGEDAAVIEDFDTETESLTVYYDPADFDDREPELTLSVDADADLTQLLLDGTEVLTLNGVQDLDAETVTLLTEDELV